jgi:hypothetical protein
MRDFRGLSIPVGYAAVEGGATNERGAILLATPKEKNIYKNSAVKYSTCYVLREAKRSDGPKRDIHGDQVLGTPGVTARSDAGDD